MPKRRRFPVVCTVCKARKVRCDLQLPCSSCVRHKTELLCKYEGSDKPTGSSSPSSAAPSASSGTVTTTDKVYLVPSTSANILARFAVLSDVVAVNPVPSAEDRLDFYAGYSPMSSDPILGDETNHGPFTWHSIVRVDPGLSGLWGFVVHNRPASAAALGILTVFTKAVPASTEDKQLLVLDRIRQHLESKFARGSGSRPNVPLGLTFNDPNARNVDMTHEDRLHGILPPADVVSWHVDRFFTVLYPFFPFLDELLFRGHLERLLGPAQSAEGRERRINSRGVIDAAHLGLLCIVLRISFLALISNEPAAEDAGALMRWPIGIEFVDYARSCLTRLQAANCSNLHVLRLMLFMRLYMEVAAEDIEGPARDMFRVNNAVLVYTAYSIGLNREPDIVNTSASSPRLTHVRRKLWAFIQFKDLINAIKFGLPFASPASFSDTKFPILTPDNHNCATPGNDELVARIFDHIQGLVPLMRNAVECVLRVGHAPTVAEVTLVLNPLEEYLHSHFGSIARVLEVYLEDTTESRELVLVLPLYIPVQIFLISVYSRLFLKYEVTAPSVAFFYCKKLLSMIAPDSLPYLRDLLRRPHPFFQYGAQLVMNPQLEYFMHRLIGFLASWMIRLGLHVIRDNQSSSPVLSVAQSMRFRFLMRSLSRCAKACLLGVHELSHRYCYAWRIATTFTYVVRILLTEDYYVKSLGKASPTVPPVHFTDEQVMDLITLLDPIALSVDLSLFSGYWNLVLDVIKLGKASAGGVKIFNPMDCKSMFDGLPQTLSDLTAGSFSRAAEEQFDSSLFPDFDARAHMHSAMGSFFEGPEFYFEAFNSITSNQPVLDNLMDPL